MICPSCQIETITGLHIFSDGGEHVVERCPKCDWNPNKGHPYLPKPEGWEDLPVLKSYLSESYPCAIRGCKNIGTQYHHFFPRHLFSYSDDAPGAYLCYYHHMQQWHKILTPNMCKRKSK